MDTRRIITSLLIGFTALLALDPGLLGQGMRSAGDMAKLERHQMPDWLLLEPYLPDPRTATAARLELEGDVLRARRFDEDALEYYQFALNRGGDVPRLLNRIGITQLTLSQPAAARLYFAKVVALQPKVGAGWNNLGATEYFAGNYRSALTDYSRAVKFEKRNAVFHANLATAYFQLKDYESARREFAKAYKLDANVFRPDGGNGIQARVLSATERGRFCFELAKVAALGHDDVAVMAWLTKASEAGLDLGAEMVGARGLEAYRVDPRVLLLEQNAKAMGSSKRALASVAVPTLPAELSKPD
ncbi:tetratricopeptide repeat protein [Granulicella tundricola]|uniref:Tetratricopeptide TPR_1 repeat-containing protein n=1 Tax=Granulicella tundricola (strain ATCC BAA-1859 / DSM 23138 / MP5ACTX9) TaxID=1198114 RepID=E8X117_GRATM|nr:tetratricopeptide repeat protein [Granulicella tundricola]ADW67883.1 Tetratricopeptide TPR_1 repeat-containing protein [Granulicella tundricola MP5ACTX9]